MFCKTNILNIPGTAEHQFTDGSVKFHICPAMEKILPVRSLVRQRSEPSGEGPRLMGKAPNRSQDDRRSDVTDRGKP